MIVFPCSNGQSVFNCVCCVLSLIWLRWVDFEFGGSRFKNYVRGLQLLRTEGYFIEPEFMECIISVATSLIWLCWVDFPYSYIPSWIPLKNLRVLRIERSDLETLWLHESQAPEHLRELYIDTEGPLNVPKSIGKLRHLEKIVVEGSVDLTLPDELCHLQSLKHLELRGYRAWDAHIEFEGCSSLNMLPDSFGNLMSLENLSFSGWSNLEMLPDAFGNLTKLQTIDLRECSSLQLLPDLFGKLTNLQTIDLGWCNSLQVLPDSFGNFTNLQTIDLTWCSSLQVLPDSFGNFTNLQTIKLSFCYNLQVLPDSFGNLTNLQTIMLSHCNNLQVLPDSFGNLTNLQTIDLSACHRLQVLPDSFGNLIQLEVLKFDSLTVSREVFEKMHTFKCSGMIDFNEVEVLPAPFLRLL